MNLLHFFLLHFFLLHFLQGALIIVNEATSRFAARMERHTEMNVFSMLTLAIIQKEIWESNTKENAETKLQIFAWCIFFCYLVSNWINFIGTLEIKGLPNLTTLVSNGGQEVECQIRPIYKVESGGLINHLIQLQSLDSTSLKWIDSTFW